MATSCKLNIEHLTRPQLCDDRRSGVRRLLLVPTVDVAAFNAVIAAHPAAFEDYVTVGSAAMTEKAVELKPGCEFIEVAATRDLGELKYTVQGNRLGQRSLHTTLEIHHAGFRRKLPGFFSIAANLEWVLLVQTASGEWHLVGDPDRGAVLTDGAEATSGKAATDDNGATITFEADTVWPRILFAGWSPDNDTYGVEMCHEAVLLASDVVAGEVIGDENGIPLEIILY